MHILENYIEQNLALEAREKALLTYYLSCFIYEGSKLILFFLFFFLLHRLDSFLYSLLLLLPLRIISGGLHFKHYTACLAFSFAYFLIVTFPLMTVQLPFGVSLILLITCAFTNFHIGPVTSDARPALQTPERNRGKLMIFIVTCYETILTALFFHSPLAATGFWTIILHTLQLMIANTQQKRGENHV